MDDATIWWLLALAAVGTELATGTFYLLMLALGLAAGAVAAHAGAGLPAQLATAAVVGGAAVFAWYLVRLRRPPAPPVGANRDINLDIGETLHVEAWGADGTAQVQYRGARWTALSADPTERAPGPHRVREVVGNRLVLERL